MILRYPLRVTCFIVTVVGQEARPGLWVFPSLYSPVSELVVLVPAALALFSLNDKADLSESVL